MQHPMTPVGLDFFTDAPQRLVASVELGASAERVFQIFEDAEAYPEWFSSVKKVDWTSPDPKGVGSTRTVDLGAMVVEAEFIAWDPGKRCAFYLSSSSVRLFESVAEDLILEDLGAGRCRFTYAIAYTPRTLLKLAGPIGRFAMSKTMKDACTGLEAYLKKSAE